VQPWVNDQPGSKVRVPMSEGFWREILGRCKATTNFTGIEWWTMADQRGIDDGQIASGITAADILAHHKRMLEVAAEVLA
jgi:hypothetical protein